MRIQRESDQKQLWPGCTYVARKLLGLRLHLAHANVFVDLSLNRVRTTAELLGRALPGRQGLVSTPLQEPVLGELGSCWGVGTSAHLGRSREKPKSHSVLPSAWVHTLHQGEGIAQKHGK